ncbi:MAG: hypothetical protein WCV84_02995 [Patescibacteria group bacterium]
MKKIVGLLLVAVLALLFGGCGGAVGNGVPLAHQQAVAAMMGTGTMPGMPGAGMPGLYGNAPFMGGGMPGMMPGLTIADTLPPGLAGGAIEGGSGWDRRTNEFTLQQAAARAQASVAYQPQGGQQAAATSGGDLSSRVGALETRVGEDEAEINRQGVIVNRLNRGRRR